MLSKNAGIDPGKKNFAFCVVSKGEDNKFIGIDVCVKVNLINEEEQTHKCSGFLKNKKECISLPKFYYNDGNETKYYCATHKKQHVPNKNIDTSIVKYEGVKEKCKHVSTKNVQCAKGANFTVNGLEYCKVHADQHSKQLIKSITLQPYKKKGCDDVEPQVLCRKLFDILNSYEVLRTVSEVRIENQPAKKNAKIKSVASMVMAYFVYLNITYNLNINIIYVSPGGKIVFSDGLIVFMNGKITEHKMNIKKPCKCPICKLEKELNNNKEKFATNYKSYRFEYESEKLIGIYYTEYLVGPELFCMFSKYKKMDDACDAFLHAHNRCK